MAFPASLIAPVAKAFVLAQLTVCPPAEHAPHVDIFFFPKKPVYVTEAPIKALTEAMQGNPDSTFATDSRWIAFGVTDGQILHGGYAVRFDTLNDDQGNTCMTVQNFKIVIRYNPTIFIAKEIGNMECQFKMVKLHEERHVATDLKTINEFIPKIKMEVLWYLRSLGPQGPFRQPEVRAKMKAISDQISASAKPMVEKLIEVRRARQGLIDTPENYHQEAELCPGEILKLEDVK